MPPKYSVPTEPFTLPNGEGEPLQLQLRGLTALHFTSMMRTQGQAMEDLFTRAKAGEELTAADTETLVVQLLDEAPLLVGLAISFGIGEEDFWPESLDLPLADQVAILERVIALTFAREGGAKKVMGIIQSVLRTLGLSALPKGQAA